MKKILYFNKRKLTKELYFSGINPVISGPFLSILAILEFVAMLFLGSRKVSKSGSINQFFNQFLFQLELGMTGLLLLGIALFFTIGAIISFSPGYIVFFREKLQFRKLPDELKILINVYLIMRNEYDENQDDDKIYNLLNLLNSKKINTLKIVSNLQKEYTNFDSDLLLAINIISDPYFLETDGACRSTYLDIEKMINDAKAQIDYINLESIQKVEEENHKKEEKRIEYVKLQLNNISKQNFDSIK